MSSIKGVMLLPLEAECYRRHVAHHTFIKKVNSGTKIPDPANALAAVVENQAREEVGRHLTPTGLRVLRWEQLGTDHRYAEHYCELDGVFTASSGATVLLEVKASASRSSLSTGLRQLRRSLRLLSLRRPDVVGVLACGDLSAWSTAFVGAGLESPEDYLARSDIAPLDWPPKIGAEHSWRIVSTMIPSGVVSQWMTSSARVDKSIERSPTVDANGDSVHSLLGDFDSAKVLASLRSRVDDSLTSGE